MPHRILLKNAPGQHPEIAAIALSNPVFVTNPGTAARDMLVYRLPQPRQIIRMHQGKPALRRLTYLALGQSEHAGPALGHIQCSTVQIPVPDAIVSATQGRSEER